MFKRLTNRDLFPFKSLLRILVISSAVLFDSAPYIGTRIQEYRVQRDNQEYSELLNLVNYKAKLNNDSTDDIFRKLGKNCFCECLTVADMAKYLDSQPDSANYASIISR